MQCDLGTPNLTFLCVELAHNIWWFHTLSHSSENTQKYLLHANTNVFTLSASVLVEFPHQKDTTMNGIYENRATKYHEILTDDTSVERPFRFYYDTVVGDIKCWACSPFLLAITDSQRTSTFYTTFKKLLANFYLLNVALSSLYARKATILYYLQNAPLHTPPRQRECRRCSLIIDGPSVWSWVHEMRLMKDASSAKNLLSK